MNKIYTTPESEQFFVQPLSILQTSAGLPDVTVVPGADWEDMD